MGLRFVCFCLVLVSLGGGRGEKQNPCLRFWEDVMRIHNGSVTAVPQTPTHGADLQVCKSQNSTCCTRRIEEKFLEEVWHDVQSLVRMWSSDMKLLFSKNVASFQEMFQELIKQAENLTKVMFRAINHRVATKAAGPVKELFTNISLYVLGMDIALDRTTQLFFYSLFPPVYGHLVEPSQSDFTPAYRECLQMVHSPFGNAPQRLAQHIGVVLFPARLFLQALNFGIRVINATEQLLYTKECRQALVKMLYCPKCQGVSRSRPCMGYCLNVMRGCLASLGEIDKQWRQFIQSVGVLFDDMHRSNHLEQAVLGVLQQVGDAVKNIQRNGPKLTWQVHQLCGHLSGEVSPSSRVKQDESVPFVPLEAPLWHLEEALSKSNKLVSHLWPFRTFYGGLVDQLCASDLASADGPCWNGVDVVKSYTQQVVGSGIKAQAVNPEVRVKGVDLAIHRLIDKLKSINQELQAKLAPPNIMQDYSEMSSGSTEGTFSGSCDDEDMCAGSASNQPKESIKVSRGSVLEVSDGIQHNQTDTGCGHREWAGLIGVGVACAVPLLLW